MSSVFLSYSYRDFEIVSKIANDLQQEGVDVWFDKEDTEIKPGQDWDIEIKKTIKKVTEALKNASFIILFISKNTRDSKNLQHEFISAFNAQKQTGGSRIIPVLLEQVELPKSLSSLQYVDFSNSYYRGMQKLIATLKTAQGPKPKDILSIENLAKEVAGEVAKILNLENRGLSTSSLNAINPKLVFVITAFSADMEPIFEGIKAAGSSLGLDVKRVKDVIGDYRITDKIIQLMKSARFIVADLTHERPNVYFELGYARGMGKTVLTIARQGTNVHFDVKDWAYIPYIDSRTLEGDIKKRLEHELSKDSVP